MTWRQLLVSISQGSLRVCGQPLLIDTVAFLLCNVLTNSPSSKPQKLMQAEQKRQMLACRPVFKLKSRI